MRFELASFASLLLISGLYSCSNERSNIERSDIEPSGGTLVGNASTVPPAKSAASAEQLNPTVADLVPRSALTSNPPIPPSTSAPWDIAAPKTGPCKTHEPHRVPGEEDLYVLGLAPRGEIGPLVFSDQHIYFIDGLTMMRAEKPPGMRMEVFAEWSKFPSPMRVDGDTVYWIDVTTLHAKSIDGRQHRRAALRSAAAKLVVDDSHVYVADARCEHIQRLSKDELSVDQEYPLESARYDQRTSLAADNENVYCANTRVLSMQPKSGGPAQEITEPDLIFALAPVEDRVYFLTDHRPAKLGYVDKRTGRVTVLSTTPGSGAAIHYDAKRRSLYWQAPLDKLMRFDIDTENFRMLSWFRRAQTTWADGDFLYFNERVAGPPCNPYTEASVITRFPKDIAGEPWPWVPR